MLEGSGQEVTTARMSEAITNGHMEVQSIFYVNYKIQVENS
jgi:hypothetical protein